MCEGEVGSSDIELDGGGVGTGGWSCGESDFAEVRGPPDGILESLFESGRFFLVER